MRLYSINGTAAVAQSDSSPLFYYNEDDGLYYTNEQFLGEGQTFEQLVGETNEIRDQR